MRGVATAVEHRNLDPPIVTTETGAPGHRSDPGVTEIQLGGLLLGCPHRRIARLGRSVNVVGVNVAVDGVLDALRHRISVIQVLCQIRREPQCGAGRSGEPAVHPHAVAGEGAQVDVASAVATGDVMVHPEVHCVRVGEFADRFAVVTDVLKPGHYVAATVEPGDARRATHREVYLTAGQVQILGDLATGLARADHQHLTGRQPVGAAVLRGVNLCQLVRQSVGQPRHSWHLVRPGSQHYMIGDQLATAGTDQVAALAVTTQPGSR